MQRSTRRPLTAVLLIAVLATAVILTACGQGSQPASSGQAEPQPAGADAGPRDSAAGDAGAGETQPAAFPVTIPHKFGQVEIPAQPTRVLTLGFSEQDPVLALGVKPIAVRYWFGDHPYAVWPWAQDELGDATPEVLQMPYGDLDFERIASLRPDLIVATHSGITAEEYERLAGIAPTLAQPGDYPDFGVPWQEQTLVIGRALGLEDLARQRVDEVEAAIAAARQAHPEFEGATVAWASPAGDGQYWAVGPNTPPLRFLFALGFRMRDELAQVIGDLDSAAISAEQLHLLDADVLIFQADSEEQRAALEADPLFQRLDAAAQGRVVWFVGYEDPVYGALSFSTVLSLPYALEHLVPQLAGALAGGAGAGGQ
ncbi:MAG: ABC transporter substrate-binding protein [Thermaerobacter sp.]